MSGKGGGAWKVAYADFVTAMMAFFLVMWIVGQNKPMKEAVAGYFRDPFGFGQGAGGSQGGGGDPTNNKPSKDDRVQLLLATKIDPRALPTDDPKEQETRKSYLLKLHDGLKTTVGTQLLFDEGSAELNKLAEAKLAELAPLLRGKPNKIEIRGHATNRPLPSDSEYKNVWELCYARCQATRSFLEQQGVESERMRLSQAGSFEPHTQASEPGSQAKNARVEVYLMGEHVEDMKGNRKEREERISPDSAEH